MKGELMLKCLERLAGGACALVDLTAVIATAPYGSSHREITRRLDAAARTRERAQTARLAPDRAFPNLLYRLKQDGLITTTEKNQAILVKMTERGKHMLKRLVQRKTTTLPHHAAYAIEKESSLKIVMFDIPERERRKRRWLNAALKHLKFTRLQKSVLAGNMKLPASFIVDLERLRLTPYVEIFAVSKFGTLTQLSLPKHNAV